MNTFCVIPGFVSPIVVSYFTYQNQTTESWKIVFIITATLLILSGIIYILFASSTLQEFKNEKSKVSEKSENTKNDEEMIILKSNDV